MKKLKMILFLEQFDEKKFCKYYLRSYMKLKELDKQKLRGIKYSKAFSEFTCLVYANISELASGFGRLSQTDASSLYRVRTIRQISFVIVRHFKK